MQGAEEPEEVVTQDAEMLRPRHHSVTRPLSLDAYV